MDLNMIWEYVRCEGMELSLVILSSGRPEGAGSKERPKQVPLFPCYTLQ
jgi:hypothetical protein